MSDMEEQQNYERLEYVEGEQKASDVVLEDDLDAHPHRPSYTELSPGHDPTSTDLYTTYSSSHTSAPGYDNGELISGIGSNYHYDQHQSAQLHDENSHDNSGHTDDSGYHFHEKTPHETIENQQHFEQHSESLAEHHYDESKPLKTKSFLDDDDNEDVVKAAPRFVDAGDNNVTQKTDSTLPELGGLYSFHSNKESEERDTYNNFSNNTHEEHDRRFDTHELDHNRNKTYEENKLGDTNGNDENQRLYGSGKDRDENIENESRLSDSNRSTTPKHDSISSKLDKYGRTVESSNSPQTPRSRIEDNEMPAKGKVSSLKSLFESNAVHNSDASKRSSYKHEYGVGKSTGVVNKGVFQ